MLDVLTIQFDLLSKPVDPKMDFWFYQKLYRKSSVKLGS